MDGSSHSKNDCPLHATIKDGRVRRIADDVFWTKEGKAFPVEYVTTPLVEQGKLVGAATVFRDITERQQAAKALLLEKGIETLREVLKKTVMALATTTTMRDPYTTRHQEKVAQLACALAQEMGLSADGLEGMRVMGLLHDIGMMAVPIEILYKPGKMSDYEYEIIKAHTQVGYEILKELDFPWPVAQVALQHHERLDGSGYPAGLSSRDIILEARILMVADVFDQLASDRPNRPGLGTDHALEELSRNKSRLYDPEVVDICIKLFNQKGFKFQE